LIVNVGFLRLLFVGTDGFSIEFISDEIFLAFFDVGGSSVGSEDGADLMLLFDIIGVFERLRVECGSGDGTRIGCLTSTAFVVFGFLITGSVGLGVSGGGIVDVFGFDRFRLARFVGKGGDVVVTIISGSVGGETFFSFRADRFDVFFSA